jgi:hypothetical protein
MTDLNSPYYDNLELSFNQACHIINQGVQDRKRAAHSPVVATIDANGVPSQRVMVLRDVDWARRTVRFHTDVRTSKIVEAHNKPISALFYEPDAKAQIRLTGIGHVAQAGEIADVAWDCSTLFARRCYLAEIAPGTAVYLPTSGLPDWVEGKQPSTKDIGPARKNFSILLIKFDCLEWLYLANSGHRRARWRWFDDVADWRGRWLVP